ncbi:hypothetical protein HOO54_23705 [Bacillus sp. WMMC1349]|uniref:hypothetical protein n=1 Tax=Bacillus sp. WMMC1349 TaxID=2736254 RepID=UPI0015575B84|nr:hypothetical protein [Bacillus sp. WMMC1349]NPC91000.1 hypothetical protein [Bacillus sp. WMMC1349]NPC91045.1 hypothetical protein [Bacillus sp. WMMC1349]NPC94984.1 hypothetical protein [Bacillus sp. WMMC1349]NPC95028.1 hypothetical protein [Bacillus sp. WMMC1349]NPC95062.1 hypothetical protein [Bacillus sp. WMMC1349]
MGTAKRLIIRYKNDYRRTVGHNTLWRNIDSLIELKRRYGFLNDDLEYIEIDGIEYDLDKVRAALEKHGYS